jgi:hypothetical protein
MAFDKGRVREAADRATEALVANQKVKDSWSDELKKAFCEADAILRAGCLPAPVGPDFPPILMRAATVHFTAIGSQPTKSAFIRHAAVRL